MEVGNALCTMSPRARQQLRPILQLYASGDKISATSDDDETGSEIDDLRFDSDFDGDDNMAAL